MTERKDCPECGRKNVAVFVPKGGDGSAVKLRPHKTANGWCPNGGRVGRVQ